MTYLVFNSQAAAENAQQETIQRLQAAQKLPPSCTRWATPVQAQFTRWYIPAPPVPFDANLGEMAREAFDVAPTPLIWQLSQKQIMDRLVALGKWQQFKAVLARPQFETAKDNWDNAGCISSDDPIFNQYAPLIKAVLRLTDEQFLQVIRPAESV